MGEVLVHIDGWLAAGLIDEATAVRLRAAEAGHDETHDVVQTVPPSVPSAVGSIIGDLGGAASAFGPAVSIGELFGYLGGFFLLGAWAAFLSQLGDGSDLSYGVGAALAALGAAVAGIALSHGDARRSRAAGVCFLVSTILVLLAGFELARSADVETAGALVVAGIAGVAAGAAFRRLHPSLLTQIALLTSLTVLVAGGLQSISDAISQPAGWDDRGVYRTSTGADPVLLVVGQAAWWIACGLAIGHLGLREDRRAKRARDVVAHRRAAVTHFWGGLVAVLGLAIAVRLEDGPNEYQMTRVVSPWLGDLAILLLCAVLIGLAFRRDATGYLWAAAVGVVIALTDLNVTYTAGNTWIALLLEGGILLAVGVLADRLRRMLRRLRSRSEAPA